MVTDIMVRRLGKSFTDHFLVHCTLAAIVVHPSILKYTHRDLKRIDIPAFRVDLLQSKLLDCNNFNTDEYAYLLNSELRCLVDIRAPLQHKVKCCGKNDCRWLSPEARAAK